MSQETMSLSRGDLQSIARPTRSTILASLVVDVQDLTARISTPEVEGCSANDSSSLRCAVTNGSALLTTTMRRFDRNGTVRVSSSTCAKPEVSPANLDKANSSSPRSPSAARAIASIDNLRR